MYTYIYTHTYNPTPCGSWCNCLIRGTHHGPVEMRNPLKPWHPVRLVWVPSGRAPLYGFYTVSVSEMFLLLNG